MSRDLRYALQFTADDKASSKVERLNKTVERGNKKVSDGAKSNAQAVRASNEQIAKSHNQTNQTQERAAQRGLATSRRMYQDRERLGIRSEERIRREIALTETAYRRLAQSGRLSGQEQARAYQQMQQRVSSLRQELVATTKQQSMLGRGMAMGGRIIGGYQQVAGAAIGAGYVMAQPIKRTMDYEQTLAGMANTAFSDKNTLAERLAGADRLRESVAGAARAGGGTRDQAANALNTMAGEDALNLEQSLAALPMVMKVATANATDANYVAMMAGSLVQTMGISVNELGEAFDILTVAAASGKVEFNNMAAGLPKILAMAQQAGLSGLKDLPAVAAALEVAAITSGSPDQAINNTTQWLSKIRSQDTIRAAANIEVSPGKSIDLIPQLNHLTSQGMNNLEAFDYVVENFVIGTDKTVQSIQKKLATAQGEERETLLRQLQLSTGAAVARILPDQESQLGYLGYRNNRDKNNEIVENSKEGRGAVDLNFAVQSSTGSFKAQQAKNAVQEAEYEAYQKLTASVGDAALKIADYAAQYPSLTQFMIVAKDALNALALAAGAATAIGMLRGGSLPVPGKGGGSPKIPRQPSGQSVQSAGSSRLASGMVIGAPVVFGAVDAYGVSKSNLSSDEKETAYTDIAVSTAAQAGGGFAGLKGGAALGAPLGPVGSAILGAVGAVVGSGTADWAATELKEVIRSWNEKSPEELAQEQLEREKKQFAPRLGSSGDMPTLLSLLNAPSATEQLTPDQLSGILQHVVETGVQSAVEKARQVPQELKITTTVDVKNGNITAEVNASNSREARRN